MGMTARWYSIFFTLIISLFFGARSVQSKQISESFQHLVEPGDTWEALAYRYRLYVSDLKLANPHPNPQRQPAIGSRLAIPGDQEFQNYGTILRSSGGILPLAAALNANPWRLALQNNVRNIYTPVLYGSLFIPGGSSPPREMPIGIQTLELSQVPSAPGQGLAIRAKTKGISNVFIQLNDQEFATFLNDAYLVGVIGTGAFYPAGDHALSIAINNEPLWSQPWRMEEGSWTFQQITLTGTAAAIDQESIRIERERLSKIWNVQSNIPMWSGNFEMPIREFLGVSADYGVRRSYNGGPFRSYHEGVDYSAYGGTEVFAPADGTVALAEFLDVRGGAILIDHGLGIFSGLYHLSEITAQTGQTVEKGQHIGKVGTTGLSTGNHLHWDLLVAGTWIDAMAWLDQNLACFVLDGWGETC